jgi:hypothetical protein
VDLVVALEVGVGLEDSSTGGNKATKRGVP